jgi:hypothetical protein
VSSTLDAWGKAYMLNRKAVALGVCESEEKKHQIIMFAKNDKFPKHMNNIPVKGVVVKNAINYHNLTKYAPEPTPLLETADDHFIHTKELLAEELQKHYEWGAERNLIDDEDDGLDEMLSEPQENEFYLGTKIPGFDTGDEPLPPYQKPKTKEELEQEYRERRAKAFTTDPDAPIKPEQDPNLPYKDYPVLLSASEAKSARAYDEDYLERSRKYTREDMFYEDEYQLQTPPKTKYAKIVPRFGAEVTITASNSQDKKSAKIVAVAGWASNAPFRDYLRSKDEDQIRNVLLQLTSYQIPPTYNPNALLDNYKFPAKFKDIREDIMQLEKELQIAYHEFSRLEGSFILQLEESLPKLEDAVYRVFTQSGEVFAKIVTTMETEEGAYAIAAIFTDVRQVATEMYTRKMSGLSKEFYAKIPNPPETAFDAPIPPKQKMPFKQLEEQRLREEQRLPTDLSISEEEYNLAKETWETRKNQLRYLQVRADNIVKAYSKDGSAVVIEKLAELRRHIPKSFYIEQARRSFGAKQ